MKQIEEQFNKLGLIVEFENGDINIAKQDASKLLKKFNLKSKESIFISTFKLEEGINGLLFSTETIESVVFNGVEHIVDWFFNKSRVIKNWHVTKMKHLEHSSEVIEFRPTLILDKIRKHLIASETIKSGMMNPTKENRRTMIVDNKFAIVYIYLQHSEFIDVVHIASRKKIKFEITGNLIDKKLKSIEVFIISKIGLRLKLRKILENKIKFKLFKK